MKGTERNIYYYDVMVERRAVHAHVPRLLDLANVWRARFEVGACSNERENGAVAYRVGDIRIDLQHNTLSMLIRRVDRNAADAVYSHIQTGRMRVARKRNNEGGDTAAHLTISLAAQAGYPNTYLCMLEGMSGISHRHVQSLLNTILRLACSDNRTLFEYDDPAGARRRDGTPKRHPFVPHVEFRGHLSETVIRDLERGTISRIELVAAQARAQLGGDQYLVEDEYALKIRVDRNLPQQNRFRRLVAAMQTKRAAFQRGRIVFKDEYAKTHTIECDLETGTPEQQTYIKSFIIRNIDPPLAQSSEQIVDRLLAGMVRELRAQRDR